jgi:hypothetical protein
MSTTPAHRHVVHGQGFVVLPNSAVNDDRLSFRARGLLAYMLARPPGWAFSASRLSREGREGRDAIETALKELASAGYYRARKMRMPDDRGRLIWVTVTEVADTPDAMPALGCTRRADFQGSDFQGSDFQGSMSELPASTTRASGRGDLVRHRSARVTNGPVCGQVPLVLVPALGSDVQDQPTEIVEPAGSYGVLPGGTRAEALGGPPPPPRWPEDAR